MKLKTILYIITSIVFIYVLNNVSLKDVQSQLLSEDVPSCISVKEEEIQDLLPQDKVQKILSNCLIVGQENIMKISPEKNILWTTKNISRKLGRIEKMTENGLLTQVKGFTKISTDTGKVQWDSEDLEKKFGTINNILKDGFLITDKRFIKIDMETGEKIWDTNHLITTVGDVLNVTEDGMAEGTKELAKIDLSNGKMQWVTHNITDIIGKRFQSVDNTEGERVRGENGVARLDNNTGEILFSTQDITQEQKDTLKKFGINNTTLFYSSEYIDHIIQMRKYMEEENRKKLNNRPLALIFYPSRDSNQAFLTNNIDEFLERYNSLYYEITTEEEMYTVLDTLIQMNLPVDTLIIGGHATAVALSFGDANPAFYDTEEENKVLDFSDKNELEQYKDIFVDANIVLKGCSAGSGAEEKQNISNLIRTTLGQESKHIYASKVPMTELLSFENGYFKNTLYFDIKGRSISEENRYDTEGINYIEKENFLQKAFNILEKIKASIVPQQ